MNKKVILISIDGMRPDGLQTCGNDFVKVMEKTCAYTYSAQSMNPSVTFPCHFSMAHSVTPQRHGNLTNTYVPQVRPVSSIFQVVARAGGVSAMFYGWEPLPWHNSTGGYDDPTVFPGSGFCARTDSKEYVPFGYCAYDRSRDRHPGGPGLGRENLDLICLQALPTGNA